MSHHVIQSTVQIDGRQFQLLADVVLEGDLPKVTCSAVFPGQIQSGAERAACEDLRRRAQECQPTEFGIRLVEALTDSLEAAPVVPLRASEFLLVHGSAWPDGIRMPLYR
jgi:hypothetical protein